MNTDERELMIDELEQERDSLALKLCVTEHKLKAALDERDEALAYATQVENLEAALESVVNLVNNYSEYLSASSEVIHAEATLERLYKSRQQAQEADDE